jgi:hypothetical protein
VEAQLPGREIIPSSEGEKVIRDEETKKSEVVTSPEREGALSEAKKEELFEAFKERLERVAPPTSLRGKREAEQLDDPLKRQDDPLKRQKTSAEL